MVRKKYEICFIDDVAKERYVDTQISSSAVGERLLLVTHKIHFIDGHPKIITIIILKLQNIINIHDYERPFFLQLLIVCIYYSRISITFA